MSADPAIARPVSRRSLLKTLAAAPLISGTRALGSGFPRRIVSLDYALASTLLSIGVRPVAVASLADWEKWVVAPEMPADVVDLGSSWEVNFEVLIDLKPDLILTTPYLEALKPKLEAIAPVVSVPVYSGDGKPVLPAAYAATLSVGARIGRHAEASRFLAESDAFFEACRMRISALDAPPVALVSLMDARHARIYGRPGLYQGVLDRLGIENLWTGVGNYWGFDTIGLEALAAFTDPRGRLIAFEPLPRSIMPQIEASPLWRALPFSRQGHFSVLPGVLMFGMVTEALRFASLLTEHLEAER
jgi:iron complex transport system substrate-binding protein